MVQGGRSWARMLRPDFLVDEAKDAEAQGVLLGA